MHCLNLPTLSPSYPRKSIRQNRLHALPLPSDVITVVGSTIVGIFVQLVKLLAAPVKRKVILPESVDPVRKCQPVLAYLQQRR